MCDYILSSLALTIGNDLKLTPLQRRFTHYKRYNSTTVKINRQAKLGLNNSIGIVQAMCLWKLLLLLSLQIIN